MFETCIFTGYELVNDPVERYKPIKLKPDVTALSREHCENIMQQLARDESDSLVIVTDSKMLTFMMSHIKGLVRVYESADDPTRHFGIIKKILPKEPELETP